MTSTPVEIRAAGEPAPRRTFSASRLKTWMQCPMKAHLHYDQHEPQRQSGKASFGTIIHIVLDYYQNTGNRNGALAMFYDLWENPEKVGVEPEWWPKFTTWEGLRQRGRDIILKVHEQLQWDKRELLATEHRFLVPFGKFWLTGAVDLLEIRRSGNGKELMRIVDYKTASRRPTKAELFLDPQFTIYLYASEQIEFWVGNGAEFPGIPNGEWLFECYQDMPRRAIWHHLWDAKEIDAGPRDDNDMKMLYRVAVEIEKADEAGIYIPRVGEACGLCDYPSICGLEIPTPEEVRAHEDAWI